MNHIRETKVFVLCREGSTFDMDELELELWYLHLEGNLKGKVGRQKLYKEISCMKSGCNAVSSSYDYHFAASMCNDNMENYIMPFTTLTM